MSKLNVLMCVYDEGEFIDYALKACVPFVKNVVVVEGAYKESIKIGANPRSTDGTIEIAKSYPVHFVQANELSDPQQRNVGLEILKNIDPDGWMLIIDGDEVYSPETFKIIENLTKKMDEAGQYAAYFKSLTFVNDFGHYCEQEFPRLFKLTPGVEFVNDNFVVWKDRNLGWAAPHVIKYPLIKYFHYSFCKNKNRFDLKKKWWETRFEKDFKYSWDIDESGKISDPSHKIYEFKGKHPEVMKGHVLYEKK